MNISYIHASVLARCTLVVLNFVLIRCCNVKIDHPHCIESRWSELYVWEKEVGVICSLPRPRLPGRRGMVTHVTIADLRNYFYENVRKRRMVSRIHKYTLLHLITCTVSSYTHGGKYKLDSWHHSLARFFTPDVCLTFRLTRCYIIKSDHSIGARLRVWNKRGVASYTPSLIALHPGDEDITI